MGGEIERHRGNHQLVRRRSVRELAERADHVGHFADDAVRIELLRVGEIGMIGCGLRRDERCEPAGTATQRGEAARRAMPLSFLYALGRVERWRSRSCTAHRAPLTARTTR